MDIVHRQMIGFSMVKVRIRVSVRIRLRFSFSGANLYETRFGSSS